MLVCPQTRKPLQQREDGLYSPEAGQLYPFVMGVPDFVIKKPEDESFDYAEHYQVDAEEFDYFEEPKGATAHEEKRLHQTIIRSVPASAKTILDAGCGRGWVAAHYIPKNKQVFSLDITPKNPAIAFRRVPSSNHTPIAADAFSMPFRDDSLDCVISSEVIEHVTDPAGFVQELFRVLKPGGSLIITTPYKEKIRYTLCIHCNKKTPINAHLHSFDEKKLENLLPGADLHTFRWKTFANKGLIHFYTHVLIKYFPYRLWTITDSLANRIAGQPLRIQAEYIKSDS